MKKPEKSRKMSQENANCQTWVIIKRNLKSSEEINEDIKKLEDGTDDWYPKH